MSGCRSLFSSRTVIKRQHLDGTDGQTATGRTAGTDDGTDGHRTTADDGGRRRTGGTDGRTEDDDAETLYLTVKYMFSF